MNSCAGFNLELRAVNYRYFQWNPMTLMNDRTFRFLLYFATPITLVFGLVVMYLVIGDHPWFLYMAIGYTVLLIIMYAVKLSIFKRWIARNEAAAAAREAAEARQDEVDG